MSFEIELENANGVSRACLAHAVRFVKTELPDRLIEAIWFGDDVILVELFGERRAFDFYVDRTGDSDAG